MFESRLISILKRNKTFNHLLSSSTNHKSVRSLDESSLLNPSRLFSSPTSKLVHQSTIVPFTARSSILYGFRSFHRLHKGFHRPSFRNMSTSAASVCKDNGGLKLLVTAGPRARKMVGIWLFGCCFTGDVVYLPWDASLPLTLKAREYEVFTVTPVKKLSGGVNFAPIGLLKMFNSGGAIKKLKYESERSGIVEMKVRGCGLFGAYSSVRPKMVTIDGREVAFGYEEWCGLVTISLRVPEQELYLWGITIEV